MFLVLDSTGPKKFDFMSKRGAEGGGGHTMSKCRQKIMLKVSKMSTKKT